MKQITLVLGLCCFLMLASLGSAAIPTPFARLPDNVFSPFPSSVENPSLKVPSASPPQAPASFWQVPPTLSPHPVPTSVAKVKTSLPTPAAQGAHSVRGYASWYCSPAQPICMHGYPPGSMVAAACGKLRAAMGPNWRGRTVTVRAAHNRQVQVRVVDWCGSTTKLIDLYQAPMSLLGGTGVLFVVSRW